MRDEGFLSQAGTRFVIFAAVVIFGGLAAYLLASGEVDLSQLETGEEETTTELVFPEPPAQPADPAAPGPPRSAQEQLEEADRIFRCIQEARGEPNAVARCMRP